MQVTAHGLETEQAEYSRLRQSLADVQGPKTTQFKTWNKWRGSHLRPFGQIEPCSKKTARLAVKILPPHKARFGPLLTHLIVLLNPRNVCRC